MELGSLDDIQIVDTQNYRSSRILNPNHINYKKLRLPIEVAGESDHDPGLNFDCEEFMKIIQKEQQECLMVSKSSSGEVKPTKKITRTIYQENSVKKVQTSTKLLKFPDLIQQSHFGSLSPNLQINNRISNIEILPAIRDTAVETSVDKDWGERTNTKKNVLNGLDLSQLDESVNEEDDSIDDFTFDKDDQSQANQDSYCSKFNLSMNQSASAPFFDPVMGDAEDKKDILDSFDKLVFSQ